MEVTEEMIDRVMVEAGVLDECPLCSYDGIWTTTLSMPDNARRNAIRRLLEIALTPAPRPGARSQP